MDKRQDRGMSGFGWGIILFLGILFFLPYLILWDDAYVRIHDTLEGEWIWYHVLLQNGLALNFSDGAVVDQVMNGLPRKAYLPGFTFMVLWIKLFGTYGGYIFNQILVHLIAFAGMFLLLKTHVLKPSVKEFIPAGVALCFFWIPFFPTFGISAAGIPLLAYAFLNLSKRNLIWPSFIIIGLFSFYSSLAWVGPGTIGISFLFILNDFLKKKRLNLLLPGAWLLLFGGFLTVNFQLLQLAFFPGDFQSHRLAYEYFMDKPLNLVFNLEETFTLFFASHYHVGIFLSIPIFFAFFTAWYKGKVRKIQTFPLLVILFICIFYGFYNWLVYFFGDAIPLVKTLKFDRISMMLPTIWFVVFAGALAIIWKFKKARRLVFAFLIIQFLLNVAANDEFQHNIRQITGAIKKPNFKNFFDATLFDEIENYIGRPKSDYRVISLGINPTIAQYNGFYTLDGLQAVYDLNYKKEFRKIMAGELEKNEVIRDYFDAWGNRCYLFSAELGKDDAAFMCSKNDKLEIKHLDINVQSLEELGGEFIFAGVKIGNADSLGLHLHKTFDNPESFWKIYLYGIKG